MRLAVFLVIGLACAAAMAGAVPDACAQGAPLAYAQVGPLGPPRGGPFMGPPRGPFGGFRGPFGRPRGPFAFPLPHGAYGPYGGFVGPRRAFIEPVPADEGARRSDAPPAGRVCFSPMETRDKIATHRLTEPFRALHMGEEQGEALRARLCRWAPEKFVYEVSVLRRDGRIVRVYMNAQNGKAVDVGDAPDGH